MKQEADATLDAAVRRFGQAWAHGEFTTLEALLSPTYTHTDIYGEIQDRSAWLSYVQSRRGAKTRISFEDVQTRMAGEVAVITGRNIIHHEGEVPRDGIQNRAIRFTQMWVKREGRWVREAFQATTVFGEHVS